MGVFSKWSFLEHVETTLEQQVTNNPIYPFKKDEHDPNVLIYKDRPPEFYISCVVSVLCTIIISVWVTVVLLSSMEVSQGIVFPAALLTYFLYRGTQTLMVRTYKINVDAGWYKYYVGGQRIHEGKLHNMYFRLQEKSSTGFPYYEIVLNGYKVSCVSISGFSKNIRKMREIAKGMSRRLAINYFDYKDVSPHHIVHWEKPAEISVSTPSLLEVQELPQMTDNVMPTLVVPPLASSVKTQSSPSPLISSPPDISSPVNESPNVTIVSLPTVAQPAPVQLESPSVASEPAPAEPAYKTSETDLPAAKNNKKRSSRISVKRSNEVVPEVVTDIDSEVVPKVDSEEAVPPPEYADIERKEAEDPPFSQKED